MGIKTSYRYRRYLALLTAVLIVCGGCSSTEGVSPLAVAGSGFLNLLGIPVSMKSMQTMLDAGDRASEAMRGLTPEQEHFLGRGVSAVLLSKFKLRHRAEFVHYLNEVGSYLAGLSDRPETFSGYHFALLESPEINAVSAPAGFVFISTGLLSILPKSEDALAAVLAHEIAHVVLGHGVAALSQANISGALTSIGREVTVAAGGVLAQAVSESIGDSIMEVTNTLLTTGYSRRQEYAADRYAAELLAKAGYDPHALVAVLENLEQLEAQHPSGGWFSTHPKARNRISELEETIATLSTEQGAQTTTAAKLRGTRFKRYMGN